MSKWARTATGDIFLPLVGSTQPAITTDPDTCTQQKIADRFRLWYGEWFLNRAIGFKWQAILSQKNPSPFAMASLARAYAMATPRVIDANIQATLDARRRHVTFTGTARTSTGVTVPVVASPL